MLDHQQGLKLRPQVNLCRFSYFLHFRQKSLNLRLLLIYDNDNDNNNKEPRQGVEGGHIPGSLNLPFNALMKDDDVTSFKSPEEMRDILKDAGIIFGSKVVSLYGIQSTAIYVIFYVNELISSYRYDDIGYNLR